MPPAFPSYILWGGRRGCGERIDVSCWEVNYSNSWLQGAPTVMNPVCLYGVAKAKVASGSPQEKGTLSAVLPLMLKASSLFADSLSPRDQCHPGQQQQRLPEAELCHCSGLGSTGVWAMDPSRLCRHSPVLPSAASAWVSVCSVGTPAWFRSSAWW